MVITANLVQPYEFSALHCDWTFSHLTSQSSFQPHNALEIAKLERMILLQEAVRMELGVWLVDTNDTPG